MFVDGEILNSEPL